MNSLDLNLLTNTLIQFFTNYNYLLPNYVPDSKKVSILLWKVKNQPNTLMLKIANQKYISDYRMDKNGEVYWKFKEIEKGGIYSELSQESEIVKDSDPTPSPNSNSQVDAVDKFHTRQIKHETRTSNSQPSESVSS